jgi:hypothetical protein
MILKYFPVSFFIFATMLLCACNSENATETYIHNRCFSESVFFPKSHATNKIEYFGVIRIRYDLNGNPMMDTPILSSPVCENIDIILKIEEQRSIQLLKNAVYKNKISACRGDYCAFDNQEFYFGAKMLGTIKSTNKEKLVLYDTKLINLNRSESRIFSKEEMAQYKEIYKQNFKIVNYRYPN